MIIRLILGALLALPLWGAMDVKKGEFTAITSGGPTQDITDVGFQPLGYCLWTSGQTAAGLATDQIMSMGCTDGTTSKSGAIASQDNLATTEANRQWATAVIAVLINAGTADAEASHSAFLSNGFRVSWSNFPAAAILIHYAAWGGADLTNFKVTEHTFSTGTGNQAYTGVGFQPDFMCLLTVNHTAVAIRTHLSFSFGCGTSSTKRWAWNISSSDAANMTAGVDAARTQRTDNIYINVSTFALQALCDLTSMDSDGFTLNQSDAPSAALFASIAFKGGSYDVGSDAMCTTGSCVDTITPTNTPKLAIVSSWALAASTTITADANMSFGAFDASAEGNTWTNQEDATLNTVTDRQHSVTKCLSWDDQVGASPTISDEADCAISGASFTATWSTNSGTAREWLWASFGDTPAAPTFPPAFINNPITIP